MEEKYMNATCTAKNIVLVNIRSDPAPNTHLQLHTHQNANKFQKLTKNTQIIHHNISTQISTFINKTCVTTLKYWTKVKTKKALSKKKKKKKPSWEKEGVGRGGREALASLNSVRDDGSHTPPTPDTQPI